MSKKELIEQIIIFLKLPKTIGTAIEIEDKLNELKESFERPSFSK